MEIFVVWKYICIVVIVIAFNKAEYQTSAFNVDAVAQRTRNKLDCDLCSRKWI